MQTEPGNYRRRGWRESRRLVELAKAVPADLKQITARYWAAQVDYEAVRTRLDTLTDTHVAKLQHLRAQIQYRLKLEE